MIAKLPMLDNGTFTVHMENDAGHVDPDPRINQIRVLADRPPTVELLKPDKQATAAPGDALGVTIRGADDHGLGRVRLEMRIKNADDADTGDAPGAAPERVKEWTGPFEVKAGERGERGKDAENKVVLEHKLPLDPNRVKPGQTVLVRAVAWDRRDVDMSQWGLDLKPQETAGPWHAVRIIDKQDKAATTVEEMDNLRTAVYKILTAQIQAQVRAATIPKTAEPVRASTLADAVRTAQVDIQRTTIGLVKSVGETDNPQRRAIRGVLHELTVGPMLDAVRQCDALIKIRDPGGFARPATELTGTQGRIIDALRTLLDVARRAQTEALAEMTKRPGGDLPDDVRKKLEATRDKLEEFLKQQKKVIEATENLAKKPVEDYTEEEKELMKQLAATEDDWSRFMKDFHSDMSKLAEQDFANPSMLKELNEVQTELKMAEDALTKKAADIAVPLEQLGYERAEEIKTNMEKWLPDKPDRERWSQEESLTDQDKEAPMAELPGELEDLVGELAEKEEDLFDEMEDVSSSAADSLDKGAGWDALDGPISNMSAKGATGNQLPNTSEMSGRSGEGRSGKSSGEFVGDEAVGKGGRKTPSRLTADPNEKGQIKDHSKDPVGGATGGGKESGQGGEGLEGPQPRQPGPRDLQRLAGKQAALRNKAEGVDVQLSITNFHHTDLKKMIEVMAQVESDLKAGRYQNALRQRQVLAEGLGDLKRYVEGEVQIRQDTSVNVPGDIQKEILGGMQDPSPPGWEEMNRRYFERLSAGGK
ncbi:MAG: hypothetical protein NTW96_15505 [Planctomycetia bacterium]|nr:hypothetical protein [Planctomycetia bacterium]